MTTSLDLNVSMPELTRTLLDIYSVSGEEKTIADAVYEIPQCISASASHP